MANNKVEICGVDTSALPVLTNERMRELFPLVHGGDLKAREEFVQGNLRLVLSVVQRFSNRGENAIVGAMPVGDSKGVATIGPDVIVGAGAKIGPNAMVKENVKEGEEQC